MKSSICKISTFTSPISKPINVNQKSRIPPKIVLITEASLNKLSEDRFLNKAEGKEESSAVQILDKIKANGGCNRELQGLQDGYDIHLEQLKNDFPNFSDVIEYIRLSFNKSNKFGNNQVEWRTPILLLGSPGVGKTHFATQLTKILNLTFKKIDFSVTNANFGLVGQERGYSDACEGELFNLLIGSKYANPVVFLDEVDKSAGDERYSPIKVLLTLLEEDAASQFQDTFVKLPINARHINWIFTANDESLIPEAVLSRMRVFTIKAPTKTQTKIIAQNMFNDLCATYPFLSQKYRKLSDDVLEALGSVNPRKIRMILDDAIGFALDDHRENIMPFDLKLDLKLEQVEKQQSIGFH